MHGILDNPVVLDDLAAGFGVTAAVVLITGLLKNGNTTFWPVRYGKLFDLDYIYSTLFL